MITPSWKTKTREGFDFEEWLWEIKYRHKNWQGNSKQRTYVDKGMEVKRHGKFSWKQWFHTDGEERCWERKRRDLGNKQNPVLGNHGWAFILKSSDMIKLHYIKIVQAPYRE